MFAVLRERFDLRACARRANSAHPHTGAQQRARFLEKAQEVAHIGSWVADLDGGGRAWWSAETHRIFGVSPETFDGTEAAFYERVHPDDRESVHAAGQAAIAQGRRFDIEHRVVWPDGAVRWVHEHGSIVRDTSGRPARMMPALCQAISLRLSPSVAVWS